MHILSLGIKSDRKGGKSWTRLLYLQNTKVGKQIALLKKRCEQVTRLRSCQKLRGSANNGYRLQTQETSLTTSREKSSRLPSELLRHWHIKN